MAEIVGKLLEVSTAIVCEVAAQNVVRGHACPVLVHVCRHEQHAAVHLHLADFELYSRVSPRR